MSALEIVLGVLLIIASLVIIVVVLLQESRQAGLSGAISGGGDTFFGKNKGRTIEAKLAKFTKFFAIGFFVLALASTLLMFFF
ncbi:MAG: preprotein translocase subunit SecG [Oscillospiraceae bacterium]